MSRTVYILYLDLQQTLFSSFNDEDILKITVSRQFMDKEIKPIKK